MNLLVPGLSFSGYMQQPYGLQQHPAWWGHNCLVSPAASEDCDSVMSDLTELSAPYLSRPAHRARKQEYPARAPMYSNTGAVIYACQLQQHGTHRIIKPAKPQKQHVNSVTATAVSKGRVLHGAAAAARNVKKNNPCSGPCDNCGVTNSPQWRHGSKTKPIVCNACGIRFLRTGSLNKAVDKKRCGTPNSVASGQRAAKRSKAEGTTTSIEDDDHQVTSGPTLVGSDGGQSCMDSREEEAAEPATTSRRAATPPVEGGCIADAAAAIVAFASKCGHTQQQQQQYPYQQPPQPPHLPGSCVSSAGASPMISHVSTCTTHHQGAAQPSPLALGGPAANKSRMTSTCSTGGWTGQQQQGSREPGTNNIYSVNRHGPSPLSVASNGQAVNRPSRFGAPAAALQAFTAATSGRKGSMTAPESTDNRLSTTTAQHGLLQAVLTPPAALSLKGTGAAFPGTTGNASTAKLTGGTVPNAIISPELIQMVQRLAGALGSVDAAIAFIKSLSNKSSGGAAVSSAADAAVGTAVVAAGKAATGASS